MPRGVYKHPAAWYSYHIGKAPKAMEDIMVSPQISNWYFLSAVSQLTLELETGHNYYGKVSVYKGIRARFIPALPARATVQNKLIAMATLLEAVDGEPGEVFEHARKVLAAKLAELGLELMPA